ncbi:MAG: hypothetical protein U0R80_20070 [Nocardioidaceae bacterium]
MPTSIRPGDLLADRYRLDDLLSESRGARFWHAFDQVLARPVAVHVIDATDDRAPGLLEAARRSVRVMDRRFLRVLDADQLDDLCYVVNEWGQGRSLDIQLAGNGPLEPQQAAWLVAETASALAAAHDSEVTHGRLVPENVLVDHRGAVRVIGLAVDAALHGLPPATPSADVTDLAGCLYAALTGTWAGGSGSAVPEAHREAGNVLRPRRVRGGIPRPLDELCAEILCGPASGAHARAAYDLGTARGVADYLRAYVGSGADLSDLTATMPIRPPGGPLAPLVPPPLPASPAVVQPVPLADPNDPADIAELADPTGATAPQDPPEVETVVLTEASVGDASTAPDLEPVPLHEQPTQAGMPVFEDSGDVGWVPMRTVPPTPPPTLDEPSPKPLFAPDPPPGTPARRPRPGSSASTGSFATNPGTGSGEYWPWDTTGPGASTGSGALVLDEDEEEPPMPGRRSLRLAIGLGVLAVALLVAMVVTNLLSGRTPLSLPTEPRDPSGSASTADAGRPVTGLTSDDLDPQATPPEENPAEAPRAVDGDPATAWRTSTYKQNLGPGGLKTGVGLVIDLGETRTLRSIEVTFVGTPTGVSVFATDEAPTDVDGLTALATEAAGERLVVTPESETSARFVTIWLTSLPAVPGGFRGEVAEVVVRA